MNTKENAKKNVNNAAKLNKIESNNSKKQHKMKEELVNLLLKLLIDVKIYHWKTKSYAEHKATDQLYEALNENIDKFVEILLGKDEARLNMKGRNIEISDPKTIEQFKKIINGNKVLLEKKIGKYLILNSDTDLLNIRDEMLQVINQLKYLLTLK